MIAAVSNNSLLAAILGPGRVRPAWRPEPVPQGDARAVNRNAGRGEYPQPVDSVELSRSAQDIAEQQAKPRAQNATTFEPTRDSTRGRADQPPFESPLPGDESLTPEDREQVRKLKERDAEVRRHEQAHKAAAGSYVQGGPSFEYETGPDGKRYAVGGEVQIDTSEVSGDPAATIRKMQQVRRAALAPGEPSAQDRAVAAQAEATERKARAELGRQRHEEQQVGQGKVVESAAFSSFPPDRGERTEATSNDRPEMAYVSGSTSAPQDRIATAAGSRLDLVA
jgi:hypothetical protein